MTVKRLLRETSAYAIASGVALAVDMGLLILLMQFSALGLMLASNLSFVMGSLIAYKLSVKFAFKMRRFSDERTEFLAFFGIGVLGLFINECVIFIMADVLGMTYLKAKLASALFTFCFNFGVRRSFLFFRHHASG